MEYALSRPDGARVGLTMVVIGRVDSGGITVHEWWDKTTPIPVLFRPSGLKAGQTIDLEGRTTTLPSGRRAIICDRVALYLDKYGYVVDAIPPLKGLFEPSVWPFRGWASVAQASGMSSLAITPLDDPEPPGEGGGSSSSELTFTEGTTPWAKSLDDDEEVELEDKVVTAGNNQFADWIYIEEPDRSSGIRVVPVSGSFVPGDVVTVSGTMNTTTDGERFIDEATVSADGSAELPPVGLVNRDVGGPAFTDGTTVFQAGVHQGYGLNNIGLLVKTWGKITYVDANGQFIYVDDGSGAQDGLLDGNDDPVVGIRVGAYDLASGKSITLPAQIGAIVHVVGISSCKMVGSNRARMIRVRSQEDISPSVVYVMTEANGGNDNDDGLTWDTAKESITEALDTAQSGVEVWVAAGQYDECITLKDGVGLYGGFSAEGGELCREERDWQTNVTTLDGNEQDAVVACYEGDASTVIDGFTIRDGGTSGVVCCYGSSPTIANNTITGNSATYGGGVYCSFSSPTIRGNAITDNDAADGGGIYCSCSSATIADNTITGNSTNASGYGGGIYCEYDPAPAVTGNTITDNSAGSGGGIYCYDSSPDITDNEMTENSATTYGGGIDCFESSPDILRNTIESNTSGQEGGGMFCNDASCPLVSGNTFADNDGGDHGGAIALEDIGTNPLIVNNLFKGNHVAGTGGGGIQVRDSSPAIINNTFVGNQANNTTSTNGNGGAILIRIGVGSLIVNNVFYKNKGRDWGNPSSDAGNSVACTYGGTATVLYSAAFSDVSGSDTVAYHYLGGTIGEGCYVQRILQNDTPTFVDETNGDFHLQLPGPSYTPIDRGHNAGASPYDEVPTTDFDGSGRPVDISNVGNDGGNAYGDMGAYERQQ